MFLNLRKAYQPIFGVLVLVAFNSSAFAGGPTSVDLEATLPNIENREQPRLGRDRGEARIEKKIGHMNSVVTIGETNSCISIRNISLIGNKLSFKMVFDASCKNLQVKAIYQRPILFGHYDWDEKKDLASDVEFKSSWEVNYTWDLPTPMIATVRSNPAHPNGLFVKFNSLWMTDQVLRHLGYQVREYMYHNTPKSPVLLSTGITVEQILDFKETPQEQFSKEDRDNWKNNLRDHLIFRRLDLRDGLASADADNRVGLILEALLQEFPLTLSDREAVSSLNKGETTLVTIEKDSTKPDPTAYVMKEVKLPVKP